MRRAIGIGLLLAGLVVPRPAEANILCRWFGYCVYESPGFRIAVVDRETGQPLADVHALAEWQMYGGYGRNGPLMVQDTVSGRDGLLTFPAWGPTRAPSVGLVLNHDPVISLFKPGYKILMIFNMPGTDETARVRGLTQDGQTYFLEPFRGTPEEWMEQLRKAKEGAAVSLSEEQIVQFRVQYLSRLKRLWAERNNVPPEYRRAGQFFWHVERDIKLLEEGKR
ncbi:MAG: hypothetical protein ACRDGM_20285 [bacterium]